MTAPELTYRELLTVLTFDAAPEPEEIRVERVAAAIWASLQTGPYGRKPWTELSARTQGDYRRMAEAAIAALDPS